MYQLRVVFTCLCAYLPRKDEFLVVIPDGRMGMHGVQSGHNGHVGHGGAQGDAIPAHVTVIEFDPVDLSPGSYIKPDFSFRLPDARRDLGLVFLTGSDIKLEPTPSGSPALRGGRVPGSNFPATAVEAEDFTWIADMEGLDPTAAVMDPICVASGTSAGGRVAARISLQGGTLAAHLLGRNMSGDPIVFSFVDANSPASTHPNHSQSLAAAVVYEMAVSSKEVALVLTPFKHSPQRLVFSFAGRPIGSTIEILIKNMPLDSVLGLTDAINPGRRIEVDPHFAMHYELSVNPPVTPWIPYATEARIGGPICAGARFIEKI